MAAHAPRADPRTGEHRRNPASHAFVAGLGSVALTGRAQAQAFPTKQIRFVVPFAAGGNADVTARIVGEGMTRKLGQSVLVDNRPGAGGVVGQELVLQAPNDGYTMVIAAYGTLFVSPLMAGASLHGASFAPVSMLSTVPMVVVVPANSRFKDWQSVVAAAKEKPGTISLGHAGNGTPNHTDILRIQENDKLSFSIVPYRGSGVGLNDVLAGQIDGYVDQLSSSLPHLKAGKLRALIVIGDKRVPEYRRADHRRSRRHRVRRRHDAGRVRPRRHAKPIIEALNKAIVAGLAEPDLAQKLKDLGATVRPSTPDEFAAFLKTEDAGIGDLAKKGLLKPE